MPTIEIQTGDGEVLVLPDNEETRKRFIQEFLDIDEEGIDREHWSLHPCPDNVWPTDTACFTYLGEPDHLGWTFTIAAVAAELWLREAERLCPFDYGHRCEDCRTDVYKTCTLSADELGTRIDAIDNAAAARAWGKKETT